MTEAVLLGTGGHARSCLDVLATTSFSVRGCVGGPPDGRLQVPYLGDDDSLPELLAQGVGIAFVAVGSNTVRQRLVDRLRELGYRTPAAVSGTAFVSTTAEVGDAAFVMHGVVIGPYSSIGEGAIVNTMASIDHDCTVGAYAHVAPGSHLAGTVRVGAGAFLGVGSAVIPERVIGDWSTVGAGAAVIRDVPERTTVAGVPAREIGRKP